MGSAIAWIILKTGLGEKAARAVAYAGLALVVLAALWGGKCAYDAGVVSKHDAKIAARAAPATDAAATERANDAIANSKSEQEMHDAVHSVPDAAPAAPSRALACQRLRKRGHAPPACR